MFENIRKAIKNTYKKYIVTDGDLEWNRAIYKCETIVAEVQAEYNNGWIKCENKLPETLDSYLVVVKMKYEWETEWEYQTDVAYYTMEDGYIDGWNTFNDWNEGQECHIVYWQPLPQPPKGE